MLHFNPFRMILGLVSAAALLAVADGCPGVIQGSASPRGHRADGVLRITPVASTHGAENISRIPLSFEANQGQTDAQVQYLARGPGYTLFLTSTEAVLTLCPDKPVAARPGKLDGDQPPTPKSEAAIVRMQFLGGNPAAQATGMDRLSGSINYFKGRDPACWRPQIPIYARVQYPNVYPGIGLVYYGNQKQLEYDFQVAPGADPRQIRLRFTGAQKIRVDSTGDLLVQAGGQELRQHRPVAYQEIAGVRREVTVDYVVQGQQVTFSLGDYLPSQPLVIDPTLSYSTYLGGSGDDQGSAIAVDAAGDVYVTGTTTSADFPTANPLQPTYGGSSNDD